MKQQRALVFLGIAFIIVTFMTGCKPSVPSAFISESDMEDILYDYHLAEAMARQESGDYATNLIAYRTAILKKYDITDNDFDTSMVYYMRHTERLHAIYERIARRMEDKARDLGSSEGMLSNLSKIGLSGDTIDIWKGEKSIALIPNQPYNVYSFSIVPDSAFRQGDAFILSLYTDFIFQDGIRDGVAALVLVYKNDSVSSRITHMSSVTHHTLKMEDTDSLGIKEIKGYFLLNKNDRANSSASTLRLMTVSNIHLFRCRTSKRSNELSTSVSAPSRDSTQLLKHANRTPVSVDITQDTAISRHTMLH